jgi:hypothetical protein
VSSDFWACKVCKYGYNNEGENCRRCRTERGSDVPMKLWTCALCRHKMNGDIDEKCGMCCSKKIAAPPCRPGGVEYEVRGIITVDDMVLFVQMLFQNAYFQHRMIMPPASAMPDAYVREHFTEKGGRVEDLNGLQIATTFTMGKDSIGLTVCNVDTEYEKYYPSSTSVRSSFESVRSRFNAWYDMRIKGGVYITEHFMSSYFREGVEVTLVVEDTLRRRTQRLSCTHPPTDEAPVSVFCFSAAYNFDELRECKFVYEVSSPGEAPKQHHLDTCSSAVANGVELKITLCDDRINCTIARSIADVGRVF